MRKTLIFLYNDYSCQFVEIGLVVPIMPFYYLAISKLPDLLEGRHGCLLSCFALSLDKTC